MSGLETLATIGSAIGTTLSVAGGIAGASQQAANDRARAAEMERKAKEERAVASREMLEKRREGELLQSKQLAGAASSGGSTTDATMLDLFADTEAQSEYNASTALYRGESNARALEAGAENLRASAKTRMPAAMLSGAGTLLGDFGKNYKSYRKVFD